MIPLAHRRLHFWYTDAVFQRAITAISVTELTAQKRGRTEVSNTMNIEVRTRCLDQHTAIVEIQGEMDVYTTPQAKEAMLDLLEKGYYHLVVDLQHANYLDSTALGMLVGTLKRVREQGGDLRLVSPPPRIRRLLEITRLVNVFPIDASEAEATENLKQEGKQS
ncbi:MAG: STAS domain-containing protein [Armatimonadota bacterium]